MQFQHIGQDFTTSVKLNLLPGKKLKRGVYQMSIQYITETGGMTIMHHMTQNMHGGTPEELTAIVGRDVRYISFTIHTHNSFPAAGLFHYRYDLRVDHLILLNLAVKLLGQDVVAES